MKTHLLPFLILFLLILGCKKEQEEPTEDPKPISQFANQVISFSTEYNASPEPWSAEKALGEPDVYPSYGDISKAWSSSTPDSIREELVLQFDKSQFVDSILVFETFNPGAIDSIFLRSSGKSSWNLVWSGTAKTEAKEALKTKFIVSRTKEQVNQIRITLNSPEVLGTNEIDALQIHGVN